MISYNTKLGETSIHWLNCVLSIVFLNYLYVVVIGILREARTEYSQEHRKEILPMFTCSHSFPQSKFKFVTCSMRLALLIQWFNMFEFLLEPFRFEFQIRQDNTRQFFCLADNAVWSFEWRDMKWFVCVSYIPINVPFSCTWFDLKYGGGGLCEWIRPKSVRRCFIYPTLFAIQHAIECIQMSVKIFLHGNWIILFVCRQYYRNRLVTLVT